MEIVITSGEILSFIFISVIFFIGKKIVRQSITAVIAKQTIKKIKVVIARFLRAFIVFIMKTLEKAIKMV